MKKILVYSFLLVALSGNAFAFFGGGRRGPLPVEEVGNNVKVNAIAKIEQARATLESIQQTKNQFIQLANEAKHLEVWAAKAMQQTLGLTQKDLDNILAIKKMSGDLYRDVKEFDKEFNKTFNLDFSKLSPEELARNYEANLKRYDKLLEDAMREKGRAKEEIDKISNTLKDFNVRNAAVVGTNQALQLGNEIANAMNANIQQLNFTLKQQEAMRAEKEESKMLKEKIEHEIRREMYKKEAELPKNRKYDYYEISI